MELVPLPGQSNASDTKDCSQSSSWLDNGNLSGAARTNGTTAATESQSSPESRKKSSMSPVPVADLMPPAEAKDAATRTPQRRTVTIRPLPHVAAAPKAPATLPAIPRYSQPQTQVDGRGSIVQSDITSSTPPSRPRVQRASTFLSRGSTPLAHESPAASFGTPMVPVLGSSNGDAATMVQLQLSLRNLKGSSSLSPANPLAIVSCAADATHDGALCWTELGRTECKNSSINPNFNQKIIVCLPRADSADSRDDVLRVDVYDVLHAAAADFEPLAVAAAASHLCGICFSTRSIVECLPSDDDAFFDNVSLFFHLARAATVVSSVLPPLQTQMPQEFNVMLAATSTPFCILTCCPVASNGVFVEGYSETHMASKYGRSSTGTTSTSLLSTMNHRHELVMNQSIASHAYSYSSVFPAFAKSHCAGRMLLMNDWAALKVTMLELVQRAREHPAEFYAFSADGQQPLSVMFNWCLYGLADRIQASSSSVDANDVKDFPDVFSVVSALTEGIATQAQSISTTDAAAFRARYSADSLQEAVQREVQMLLCRPFAATDATYIPAALLLTLHDDNYDDYYDDGDDDDDDDHHHHHLML